MAEEREVQEMERLKREQERAIKERQREEARKRREAKRKERMDLNDFKIKGLREWEINYEFHIGESSNFFLFLAIKFTFGTAVPLKRCVVLKVPGWNQQEFHIRPF